MDGYAESRPATVTIDVQQAMTLRIGASARASVQDPDSGDVEETFVRFDLSRINREVFNAEVRLSSHPAEVAYAVGDDEWNSAEMTWENRPGRGESAVARRSTSTSGGAELDISQLIRNSLEAGDNQISVALVGPPDTSDELLDAEGESDELDLILTTANVITVDSTADDDDAQNNYGHTTLREAIESANATAEAEVIAFDLSETNPVIELWESKGEITISSDMYILGPADGSTLTVRAPQTADMRTFSVASGTIVGMSDMLIQGGALTSGNGAAISNAGDLTLERVTVSGSSTAGSGGGLYNASGAFLTLNDSTVSGNSADTDGGGIYNAGTLNLNNATISNNTATGSGGGVRNTGTANLENSLIAGNTNDDDLSGDFTSQGHNLIGDGSGATGLGATGDQVGTSGSVIDPLLGPLQAGGGAAPTHQLLAGSPAIDAGDNTNASEADGRGAPRILDGPDPGDAEDAVATVDIGAFEFGTFFVNVEDDALDTTTLGDGRVDTDSGAAGDQISLRAALQELNALAGLDNPEGGVSEGYVMFSPTVGVNFLTIKGENEDGAASGDLDIVDNVTVRGRGSTPIDAGTRIEDHGDHAAPDSGTGIYNTGSLTMNDSYVEDDATGTGDGAGIYNAASGVLTASGGSVSGNYNDMAGGAGIYNEGILQLDGTLVEGNTAVMGDGGGIHNHNGQVSLDGVSLKSNFTQSRGGGVFNYDLDARLTVTASTIESNEADFEGAGIWNRYGSVTVTASSVADNATADGSPLTGPELFEQEAYDKPDTMYRVDAVLQPPIESTGGAAASITAASTCGWAQSPPRTPNWQPL